jgi:hypothetical protein
MLTQTVPIVTIPLDKQSNFGIFKDVEDGEIIFMDTSIKDNPYWQAQQLLVLSDDEIQKGDSFLEKDITEGFDKAIISKSGGCIPRCWIKKIIASYPQIEGTLRISKETVQAWIDAGTPGEGSVEIDDTIYCSVVKGKVKYGDPTKLDPQGNLLLEFGKKIINTLPYPELVKEISEYYKDVKIVEEKPSIPTDEEIKKKCGNTANQNTYLAGYKQALKDLGYE